MTQKTLFAEIPAVKAILRSLIVWSPLWIGATIVFGVLGGVYAFLLKDDVYLASQAVLVRDEANATMMRLGRFESQTQMKAAQETIMEMAKNHQVVHDALKAVGPAGSSWWPFASSEAYPDDRLVRNFADDCIAIHAPKGVEFGNTEVIYIDVKAETPERALKLVSALSESLDHRMRQVRQTRAESVLAELATAKTAAQGELQTISAKMQDVEQKAGPQLSELRSLTDSASSGSGSRAQIDQIENELRTAARENAQLLADLELLTAALSDPASYVLAPGSLLNAQPGLKKLREGLADAQLSTSQLIGRFTDAHPLVAAARDAQSSIENRLIDQLNSSKIALEADIQTSEQRIKQLNYQKELAEQRLDDLAGIRTEYSNLVSELKTRTNILQEIERQLAEAHASKQAALSISLLTRMDSPMVGDKPIGPGRITLTAIFAISGMLLSLGFVFAVTPIDGNPRFGRRWGDYMAADQRSNTETADEEKVAQRLVAEGKPKGKTSPKASPSFDRLAILQADTALESSSLDFGEVKLDIDKLLAEDSDYGGGAKAKEEFADCEFSRVSTRSDVLEKLMQVKEAFEDGSPATAEAFEEPHSRLSDPLCRPAPRATKKASLAVSSASKEDASERRNNPRTEAAPNKPVRVAVRKKSGS